MKNGFIYAEGAKKKKSIQIMENLAKEVSRCIYGDSIFGLCWICK